MDRAARSIWAINKAGQMFFARRLAPLGLGVGQFPLLSVLYAKEGLSQEEIAAFLGIDKAAVAKSLVKLLSEGYVERRGDDADARVKRVWLTEKARKAKKAVLAVESDWEARLLDGFSPKEAATVAAYLRRVDENARRDSSSD